MAPLAEVRALLNYRSRPIVLLALLALVLAQAAAGLHALRHFGKQGDPFGVPGHHVQLCLECASFAAVQAVHGGAVAAFAFAALGPWFFLAVAVRAPAGRSRLHPFRSRAPPR